MPDNSGNATLESRRSRPGAVRVAGLLLLLQAAGYVALSIYLLLHSEWRTDLMPPQQIDALTASIILMPAAILAALSAIGFVFLFRAGWLLAMTMQGATLLGCLVLYFGTKPWAIFPVMLYCIVMAFFLNSSNVRFAFYGGTVGHER
jgi:hypothetical protein